MLSTKKSGGYPLADKSFVSITTKASRALKFQSLLDATYAVDFGLQSTARLSPSFERPKAMTHRSSKHRLLSPLRQTARKTSTMLIPHSSLRSGIGTPHSTAWLRLGIPTISFRFHRSIIQHDLCSRFVFKRLI